MHTLSKTITAGWFTDPSRYQALRHQWRTLMNSQEKHALKPLHHLLYLALIGKDWRKAFGSPKRPTKLTSGALCAWPLPCALNLIQGGLLRQVDITVFAGTVSLDDVRSLSIYLPRVPWQLQRDVAAWSSGAYPFDAYRAPDGDQS